MSSQCTLIADETDDAVQLALGFIALSSLYGKWHFESPRRSAKIWFMDAMKQGTSAAMVHVVNIVFSIGIADVSAKPGDADEVRIACDLMCLCFWNEWERTNSGRLQRRALRCHAGYVDVWLTFLSISVCSSCCSARSTS